LKTRREIFKVSPPLRAATIIFYTGGLIGSGRPVWRFFTSFRRSCSPQFERI